MIEGMRPGPHRVDPVGVAPAEVVAQALRCERLEAVAEAAARYRAAETTSFDSVGLLHRMITARRALDAALVAAGATGKAGT